MAKQEVDSRFDYRRGILTTLYALTEGDATEKDTYTVEREVNGSVIWAAGFADEDAARQAFAGGKVTSGTTPAV